MDKDDITMICLNNEITLGYQLTLHLQQECLLKDFISLPLSRNEFRILYYLASNPLKVIAPQELIDYAWGENSYISKEEIYVYINRIRAKLEDNKRNRRS